MRLPKLRLFVTSFIVTLSGSFHLGYQQTVYNAAAPVFQKFINETISDHHDHQATIETLNWLWSSLVSLNYIGAAMGALLSKCVLDRQGRKSALYINALLAVVGVSMALLAYYVYHAGMLVLSRLILGIVGGYGTAAQAVYLAEIAPKSVRGFLNSFTMLLIQFGRLVGAILASPDLLGTETLWIYLFIAELAIVIAHLLCISVICHESPVFSLDRGDRVAAERAIIAYHDQKVDVDKVCAGLSEERHLQEKMLGIVEVLQAPVVRRGAMLGILVQAANSYNGVVAINAYSASILAKNGFTERQAANLTILVIIAGLVAIISLLFTVERFGRRPMLLLSMTALTCVTIAMMITVLVYENYDDLNIQASLGYGLFALKITFMFFFGIGLGPISWFYTVELVPCHANAAAQSLSCFVTHFTDFLIAMFFWPLDYYIGAYCFLFFVVPMIATTIFSARVLPETRNRSIVEIMRDLQRQETKFAQMEQAEGLNLIADCNSKK